MENRTKEYYTAAIRKNKKTLAEIANDLGVTVETIKWRIKAAYIYQAQAVKLIRDAEHNAKVRVEEQKASEVHEAKTMLMPDTCILLERFEELRKYHLIVPRFCVNECKKICGSDAGNERKDFIAWLQDSPDVEIVYADDLPIIERYGEYKSRNCMFARYCVKFRDRYPGLEVVSFSREVRQLLTDNGVNIYQMAPMASVI